MSIKIIHTADNHIGISYNSLSQAKTKLVKERLEAIKRIVEKGNEELADYLVIAGDLFDVARYDERRTRDIINILNLFHEKVFIVPGNHDFYQEGENSLWYEFKTKTNNDKIIVLDKYEVFEDIIRGQEVRFYPAACKTLHSNENTIGWIKEIEKPNNAIHIGIAHGNVVGLGRDEDGKYFNMDPAELLNAGVDFWLLGHIHVPYPTQDLVINNPGYFMSGTHMPDTWKSTNMGNAWIIEIDGDKNVKANKFQPSKFCFKVIKTVLESEIDIESLRRDLTNCDYENIALRLDLTGTLTAKNLELLDELLNEWTQKTEGFIYFEVFKNIKQKIDQDVIDEKFTNGSLPHILLSELLKEDPDGLSTQKAFEIINETKSKI